MPNVRHCRMANFVLEIHILDIRYCFGFHASDFSSKTGFSILHCAVVLRKAGKKARANEGEEIPIYRDYFDHCIRWMKKLVGTIYTKTLSKYGNV